MSAEASFEHEKGPAKEGNGGNEKDNTQKEEETKPTGMTDRQASFDCCWVV